jgi:hypothetical protein
LITSQCYNVSRNTSSVFTLTASSLSPPGACGEDSPTRISIFSRLPFAWQTPPRPRRILFYSMLVMIPAIIFALLLYVARHG